MTASKGLVANLSGVFDRLRKPLIWIYCSTLLFPLCFALFTAVFMTLRDRAHINGSLIQGAIGSFYLSLMAMLAAVPRSILPALMIWILLAAYRPAWDESKIARYLGLALLLAAVLFGHAKLYGQSFNFIWFSIAFPALILPRLALPSLRTGLKAE